MSQIIELSIDNLDRWQEWLETLQGPALEQLQSRILRSAGMRTLEHIQDSTPRRTGRLQNSFNMSDRDNVFQLRVGNTSYVAVGTTVEYAAAVEEGYTQQAGRFVPGYWDGPNFVYRPDHGTGMVLKGKIIPGVHMVRDGIEAMVDQDLNRIAEFEFRRLYAELVR